MATLYLLYETTDRNSGNNMQPILHHKIEGGLHKFHISEKYCECYGKLADEMMREVYMNLSDKHNASGHLLQILRNKLQDSGIEMICISDIIMNGTEHKTIALSDGNFDDRLKVQLHITNCDCINEVQVYSDENETLYDFVMHFDPAKDDVLYSYEAFIKKLYKLEHGLINADDIAQVINQDQLMLSVFTTEAFFQNIPSIRLSSL